MAAFSAISGHPGHLRLHPVPAATGASSRRPGRPLRPDAPQSAEIALAINQLPALSQAA